MMIITENNIDKKLDLKTGGVLIYPVLEVSGPLEGTFSHLGKVTTGLFTHGRACALSSVVAVCLTGGS